MKRRTTVLLLLAASWGLCVTGCANGQTVPSVPDTSAAAAHSQEAASQAGAQDVMPQAETQAASRTGVQAASAPSSETGEATTTFAGETSAAPSGQISIEEAKKAALDRVPGAGDSDIWIKTDWEDGRMVYEGEIRYGDTEYEFEIDAANGTFLDWDKEPVFGH